MEPIDFDKLPDDAQEEMPENVVPMYDQMMFDFPPMEEEGIIIPFERLRRVEQER